MAAPRPPLTVRDDLQVPNPPTEERGVLGWLSSFVTSLKQTFRLHAHFFPAVLSGELRGHTYTEATKPSASAAGSAAIILSTDAATKPQMSDGSSWLPLGAGGGPGSVGPMGPPGMDGTIGDDGGLGPPGPAGPQGVTGAQGPTGPAVFLAAEAIEGEPGSPGPRGLDGASGAAGAQGPAGPAIFLAAEPGEDGMIGAPGSRGADGATGAQGPVGPAVFFIADPGEDGMIGPPGPTGPQGPAGGGGGLTLTEIEKDLGSVARRSGSFDITGLAGLTVGKQVLVVQKAGPYTGKGTRQDEAEMDQANATGYVVDANTIRVYWTSSGPMMSNVKFGYAVSG